MKIEIKEIQSQVEPLESGENRICSSAKGEGVWVVVKAKPGQEVRAKGELERQRFEVYLPMRLFEVKAGRNKGELRAAPFLPPYLFARVPVKVEAWRQIFSTYGVATVFGFTHDRAFGVKDAVVDRIKLREDAGYIRVGLAEDVLPVKFAPGDAVALDDVIDAVFLEAVDAKRSLILVSGLFGRDSRHVVDLKRLYERAAK